MANKDVTLGAGTKLYVSDMAETPAFTFVPKLLSFGEVGAMAEPKQKTSLEDLSHQYGSGLKDAVDKTIKGHLLAKPEAGDTALLAEYTAQQAFINRCKAEEEFDVKIEFPNGTIAEFTLKTLGYKLDEPKGEDWLMFTVNGKQNGDPVWTEAV